MNGPTLQVQMLGQFTLRYGDRTISDSDDRSRRVWSLLAYMLYNHGRSFAQEELIHLYWSNGEKSADPGNALKSIFHRIRTALDKLHRAGQTAAWTWPPAHPPQSRTILLEQRYAAFPRY